MKTIFSQFTTALICLSLSFGTMSQTVKVDNTTPNETFFSPKQPISEEHMTSMAAKTMDTAQVSSKLVLTPEQLSQRPDLLVRALIPVLKQNDGRGASLLLPLYQQQNHTDPFLLRWAEALVAQYQGHYSEAIGLYQTLLEQHPEVAPMRLQLALTLFKNQQNIAAKVEFQQLQNMPLPTQLQKIVADYLEGLKQRDKVNFQASINYLNEKNVNNAPPLGITAEGTTPSSKPESAEGFSYFLAMNKNWSLPRGLFWRVESDINGKYYWDNHKYNELGLRASTGLGYKNAKLELSAMPFVERFLYAGGENASNHARTLHRYSKTQGISFNLAYWFTRKWQLVSNIDWGKSNYFAQAQQGGNGNYYSVDNTLVYVRTPHQFWTVGADYYYKKAQRESNSFERQGIRLGWGQDWMTGFSTRLNLSYAKRHYAAPSIDANNPSAVIFPSFFKVKQKNQEYAVNLTVWHRDVEIFGIKPKVTWSYQKVTSNNLFAEYDRNKVFLSFSKGF